MTRVVLPALTKPAFTRKAQTVPGGPLSPRKAGPQQPTGTATPDEPQEEGGTKAAVHPDVQPRLPAARRTLAARLAPPPHLVRHSAAACEHATCRRPRCFCPGTAVPRTCGTRGGPEAPGRNAPAVLPADRRGEAGSRLPRPRSPSGPRASPGASVVGRAPPAQFPQRPLRRGVPGGTAHAQPRFELANRRAPPRRGGRRQPGPTRTRGGRPRRKVASFIAANGNRNGRAQHGQMGGAGRAASPAGGREGGERRGAAPLNCKVTSSCLRCRQVGEIERCYRSRGRALLCCLPSTVRGAGGR